jgi:hypothetical protein
VSRHAKRKERDTQHTILFLLMSTLSTTAKSAFLDNQQWRRLRATIYTSKQKKQKNDDSGEGIMAAALNH